MDVSTLENEIKSNKIKGIYLLYGEEVYLLENAIKNIKKQFGEIILGINYILIDENNIRDLISNIETPSFGYNKKLIIVKYSNLFKKESKGNQNNTDIKKIINDYITKNIKEINESVVLIFIAESIDTIELVQTINEIGNVCNFKVLTVSALKQKLKSICSAYKVKIEDDDLQYFIENCGTNLQELINEIRKLIEYAGQNGKITKQAIDKLSIKKVDSIIFDLTDNLGKKDLNEALKILNELIYNKEPLQKILITLYKHLKKVYITKLSEKSNRDLVETLKLSPKQTFLVSKYKKQAQYFNESELREILEELIKLDENTKNGKIDINIGLESILCNYFSNSI